MKGIDDMWLMHVKHPVNSVHLIVFIQVVGRVIFQLLSMETILILK